ncbi:hypothetical protein GCM10010096_14120 [Alcaligenes pakistanensis]|uniref:DUF3318 domain-containing protein n=1 Tax=Alcaligenes pakistanensis TaxID=1482717 RepID=A0A8H9M856_9BURK|nr:hypothetical protein [Alcaligenes pakistanensis]GHC44119.1 hypothetical protein GCM10010096_14120 [Alcaligenes pakistanensis]HCA16597.1 hypothetical protein [Alcaligenes faecalis]
MSTKQESMSAQERAVRIELLRVRASLERQSMSSQIHSLGDDLSPGNLWNSVKPSGLSMGGMVTSALSLSRRYPFLLSGASAVISSFGGRWMRLGALALGAWKLYDSSKASREKARRVLVPVRRKTDTEV